jgi:hypothetical protein
MRWVVALAAMIVMSGCVSLSTYRENEARLQRRIAKLETAQAERAEEDRGSNVAWSQLNSSITELAQRFAESERMSKEAISLARESIRLEQRVIRLEGTTGAVSERVSKLENPPKTVAIGPGTKQSAPSAGVTPSSGWWCSDSAPGPNQTSNCTRDKTDCEQYATGMADKGFPFGDCYRTTVAACFKTRDTLGRGVLEVCSYAMSHCTSGLEFREKHAGQDWTTVSRCAAIK